MEQINSLLEFYFPVFFWASIFSFLLFLLIFIKISKINGKLKAKSISDYQNVFLKFHKLEQEDDAKKALIDLIWFEYLNAEKFYGSNKKKFAEHLQLLEKETYSDYIKKYGLPFPTID